MRCENINKDKKGDVRSRLQSQYKSLTNIKYGHKIGLFDKINYVMIVNANKNSTFLIEETEKYFLHAFCRSGHSTNMWFTASGTPQDSHVGWTMYLITTRNAFNLCNSTDSGVDSMEFITLAAVPDILPLFQTELRYEVSKFSAWKFHRNSRFGYSIWLFIARDIYNIYMAWNSAEHSCFATLSKICLIFYYLLHEIQLEFKSI